MAKNQLMYNMVFKKAKKLQLCKEMMDLMKE